MLSAALITLMAASANTFAATKSISSEKGKTEMRSKTIKNDDMKNPQGKKACCHHHGKSHCHKSKK
jgi:hypothetical protein